MSVRRAQNRVRKEYAIGKTALRKRMTANRAELSNLAHRAQWSEAWGGAGKFDAETQERMHYLVDALAADCIIATAYREAEQAARAELPEAVAPIGYTLNGRTPPSLEVRIVTEE